LSRWEGKKLSALQAGEQADPASLARRYDGWVGEADSLAGLGKAAEHAVPVDEIACMLVPDASHDMKRASSYQHRTAHGCRLGMPKALEPPAAMTSKGANRFIRVSPCAQALCRPGNGVALDDMIDAVVQPARPRSTASKPCGSSERSS
jgi:hypothetical protein